MKIFGKTPDEQSHIKMVEEIILSDVSFESLVLPDNTQPCPKLRFAGVKVKKKKVHNFDPLITEASSLTSKIIWC